MSTVKDNDGQFMPSNHAVQLQQPKNDVVTQQPPPSYIAANSQAMGNFNQHPPAAIYIDQNGQRIPVVYGNSGVNGPYPHLHRANTVKVHDYKVWSILNIIFCCLIFGGLALHNSSQVRNRLRIGDLQGARAASKRAAIINILATISGIIIITLAVLQYTNQITL